MISGEGLELGERKSSGGEWAQAPDFGATYVHPTLRAAGTLAAKLRTLRRRSLSA